MFVNSMAYSNFHQSKFITGELLPLNFQTRRPQSGRGCDRHAQNEFLKFGFTQCSLFHSAA
jgi:hypothetical protein